MTDHASKRAEVERIDFLLDELARAVERGEVHRASYDLMAPRYLARRAALVAEITGQPQVDFAPDVRSAPGVPPVGGPGSASSPSTSRSRQGSKPVDWTTVLLFLGAFLVIVASAVFSVAVWGSLGTLSKFGLLAALTAGFYVAGWWARTRLRLSVGATALTAVASSMLLFDGWILIDGFRLTGPWPWAVLLFGCSLAYWYTEIRIASGFFGVIGAGAQVAWWWLLGSGLGVPAPVRIAGVSVVALLWLIAAERGEGRVGVGSLAHILRWAAPVVATGASAAMLADLVLLSSADAGAVVSACVVSATSGAVAWRALSARPRERQARSIVATLLQLPLFVAAWSAAATQQRWWIVAVFVAAAVTYDLLGLTGRGVAFVVAGLSAELSAVLTGALVLDASAVTTIVAVATLGALWASSARLLDRSEMVEHAQGRHSPAAAVCEVGAFALLTGASLALPVVTLALPLPHAALSRSDVLGYVGVLAAWWAAATIRPRGATAFAGSLFSFATLAAVESWAWPAPTPGLFALPLAALAGTWLMSARLLSSRYGATWAALTRWSARVTLALTALLPLAIAPLVAGDPKTVGLFGAVWDPVVLLLVASAIAATDAVSDLSRVVAALASVCFVLAASAAASPIADHIIGVRSADVRVLVVAGAALAVSVTSLWLRRGEHERLAPWFAVAATTTASVLVAMPLQPGRDVVLAAASLLLAAAWGVASACSSQWFAGAAGVALLGSVAALTPGSGEWVGTLAFGGLGLALSSVAFVRPFHRDGKASTAGSALALASAPAYVAAATFAGIDTQPGVIALLMAAAGIAASSASRRFEPGYHLAGAVCVLAIWSETSIVDDGLPGAVYALPLSVYLSASGYLHVWLDQARRHPEALDVFAVFVGVAYPALIALQAPPGLALADSLAAVVMALIALGAGIALKVRWYFFGGVVGLAVVALYRSFSAIAAYWWLVLGLIGVAMLVIALTWQRQRALAARTRASLERSFEGWR